MKKIFKKDLQSPTNILYNYIVKKKKKDFLFIERKVIVMNKKYSYEIEFLSRDVSPTGTKHFGATGGSLLKEMKASLDKFLEENGLQKKGATSGQILNAKGQVIGRFCFNSQTF